MPLHLDPRIASDLQRGLVIPACPLALTAERRLDERRQRALVRYYLDAGATGLAVGVHTTQFAIRDPKVGIYRPILDLVAAEIDRRERGGARRIVRIAGVCGPVERRITGGLLGQWAVWTRRAVELTLECHRLSAAGGAIPAEMFRRHVELTDANAAIFDAANGFAGCIAGIHEILRRQGLLEGTWCLDPAETLGPGQAEEIDRVWRAYPALNDDAFVARHRDDWLRP